MREQTVETKRIAEEVSVVIFLVFCVVSCLITLYVAPTVNKEN